MSSTTKTNKLGLSQFAGTDIPDWRSDYNSDMSKIDEEFQRIEESILDTPEEINANTDEKKYAGALAVKGMFEEVSESLEDLDNRLGYAVNVSFAYKVIIETWEKGIHNVVFNVPKLEGYSPMFWIANRHSWYIPQIHPLMNSYFFENPNVETETITVQYYLELDSLKLEGGNFSALIFYRKKGN